MEFVIVIVCLTAQIATVMAFPVGRTAALDPSACARFRASGRKFTMTQSRTTSRFFLFPARSSRNAICR